jgi:hypothetical protein
MNKIFIPPNDTNFVNKSLTEDELFRKNVLILDKVRNISFLFGIDDKMKQILEDLKQYFENVEAYEYCNDVLKIYELDTELSQK